MNMPSFFKPTALAVSVLLMALFASGCSGSGSAASDIDARLIGVWQAEGGAHYTITAAGDGYALGIVDTDSEVFEVEEISWADGVLSWTYFVPSTGYRVSEETLSIYQNSLEVSWRNQTGASGSETFTRVE